MSKNLRQECADAKCYDILMDQDQLDALFRVIQRRYEEGFRDGQKAALRDLVSKVEARFPREPKPKRPRRPETRPRLKNPIETLGVPVLDAVANLTAAHPDGVPPASILEHLAGAGFDVDIRQIRLVLRQLTLNGTVIRVAHGWYHPVPITTPIAAE